MISEELYKKAKQTVSNPARAHVCHSCGGVGTYIEPMCCEAIGGCGSENCTGSRIEKVICVECNGEGMVE